MHFWLKNTRHFVKKKKVKTQKTNQRAMQNEE